MCGGEARLIRTSLIRLSPQPVESDAVCIDSVLIELNYRMPNWCLENYLVYHGEHNPPPTGTGKLFP